MLWKLESWSNQFIGAYTLCLCVFIWAPAKWLPARRERSLYLYRFFHHSSVWPFIRCSNTNHLRFNCVWCDVHQLWRVCSKAKIKPPQTIESFERFESQSLAKSTKKKYYRLEWMDGWADIFRTSLRAKKLFMRSIKILHSNISLMSINNWQTLNDLFGFIHRRTRTDALCHGDVYIVQKGSRLKFTDILILTSIGPSN